MSWARETPVIFEGEDELQLKLRYAAIVARNPNAKLKAGYQLFAGEANYGRAMQAQAWLSDPIVQEEISRLTETGDAESLLPSLEAVQLEIYTRAKGAPDDKDAAALFRLYLESIGKIGRGTNISINQDNRVQNVIRVPNRISTDEQRKDFEERFYLQQTRSIADAKSSRPVAN